MIKWEECLECEYRHQDEICDECEDGELFEEAVDELDFEEAV